MHLLMKLRLELHARRMSDTVESHRDRRLPRREPVKQVRFIRLPKPHDPAALDDFGQIMLVEGNLQELKIRLENANERIIAGAVDEPLNVIAEPESLDI